MSAAKKPPEPRGARRKRETRHKLLGAAFTLIAERGVDGVAINEITDAADVGFGSFYNHFSSKEAIYDEIFRVVFDEYADALDVMARALDDPAEVIAVSIRLTVARARSEPSWARLLLRESLGPRGLAGGLAARLRRDIARGIHDKRFSIADSTMALVMAGGTVTTSIAVQSAAQQMSRAELKRLALDTTRIAERTAACVLHGLGLSRSEATKIAERRLPEFDYRSSILADP